MSDDPTIVWQQPNRFGIEYNAAQNAWHSGHVSSIVPLSDAQDAVVIGTETGGAWAIVGQSDPLPLSNLWENPDVGALAVGPDGPRHVFAGCADIYSVEPAWPSPVIMETDLATPAPLLNWRAIVPALPATAGRVRRIVVVRNLRRIIVACARHRQDRDTGGIFWSAIPPSRFSPADPPRAPYDWRQAKLAEGDSPNGFWDLAIASLSGHPRENLENPKDITLAAGGYNGGGLFVGRWEGPDDLVFYRPFVTFETGMDATAIHLANSGTTSVSSCEGASNALYASTSWPDGRLNSVLRSRDGGRRWTYCAARMANAQNPFDLLVARAGDQGADWNNRIAAHPGNPGMAALGWRSGTFLTLNSGQEWRLIDGGAHFFVDIHALLFHKEVPDSFGQLYIGSDGGLARVDLDEYLGPTGQRFHSYYNRRLPTLQCYSNYVRQFYGSMDISSHKHGVIVTGLQDNGNVFSAFEPSPEPWRPVDEGDGGWNAFLTDGVHVHNIMGGPVLVSASPDDPGAFIQGVVPITLPAPGDPAGLKGPVGEPVLEPRFRNSAGLLLVAVASSGNVVFGLFTAASAQPLYRWERLGSIPAGEYVSGLASYHGDRIFAGTTAGKIYGLDAASGKVSEQSVNLPKPSPSTRMQGGIVLRISGFADAEMFATLIGAKEERIKPTPLSPPVSKPAVIQSYVLAFDGRNWNNTPGAGLPNEPFPALVAVAAPNTRLERGLLVATDDAVYVSRNDGFSWQKASAGLPRRPHCSDLRYAARVGSAGGTLALSTYGRSVWVARMG